MPRQFMYILNSFNCRATLCTYAVVQCPSICRQSVCHVLLRLLFIYCVKMSKPILKLFHHGSHTSFSVQNIMA